MSKQGIGLEPVTLYMTSILSSKHNRESYSSMLDDWTVRELDEYRNILQLIDQGSLAATLDNLPQE